MVLCSAWKGDGTTVFSGGCEKQVKMWLLAGGQPGNLAYSNGDLAKAEDCYTQGLNSVSQYENSTSCLRALMVCYGNHGATGMSLGRTKKALEDCLMAATIDPNFLKLLPCYERN